MDPSEPVLLAELGVAAPNPTAGETDEVADDEPYAGEMARGAAPADSYCDG